MAMLASRLEQSLLQPSIQREHEQITGVLIFIEFHRMQMTPTGLYCEILLGPDRIRHRRTLQRSAHVEAPEFFERTDIVGHDPTILQRREHYSGSRVARSRAQVHL